MDLAEGLAAIDAEVDAEYSRLFGGANLAASPKFQEIQRILQTDPILVGPCLRWLQGAQARIARATLAELYTAEELEQMRADAEQRKRPT